MLSFFTAYLNQRHINRDKHSDRNRFYVDDIFYENYEVTRADCDELINDGLVIN